MIKATMPRLVAGSLRHRRWPVLLTLITLTLSLTLLLGVQYLRTEVKQTFVNTISETDLIVGARSGPMNLLLYSVFHIGNATNNVRWDTYQHVADQDEVDWVVPLSLGDSHKGHRVIATTEEFFERYRYANGQSLAMEDGTPFSDVYEAVVGSEVAAALDYDTGEEIVVAHGTGTTSFTQHEDHPFTITGVLEPTGTPVDRTVLISLEGFEAIHIGWESGMPQPHQQVGPEEAQERDLTPNEVTAMLVGVERRIQAMGLQRELNNYRSEPLTAIMPGATLSELWSMLGDFERALLVIAALVLVASLVGMVAVLLTMQSTRVREMAILRAVGASPTTISGLYMIECLVLVGAAALLSLGLWFGGLYTLAPWLTQLWGIHIGLRPPSLTELGLLGGALGLAFLVSLIPAWIGYRRSLAEGLTPRE